MKQELDSLLPQHDYTRRSFLATATAAGFALAVQPVCAQTMIVTDTQGLIAGDVKIPTASGDIPGYRAMPAAGGPFPTILVVQEIFGVHEHIKDLCRRLAKVGYFAVAPELYYRQGDVSQMKEISEIFSKVVSKVPDSQVMSDLDATVAWAKAAGKADTARLGITGFCYGGRIVWLYAAHNPNLRAGVAWYGRLMTDKTENQPKHPLDIVNEIRAPVLGLYGGADQGIPNDTVEKMQAALKAGGKPSEIILYPDTPHAFNADYRPSYRKQQAEDGWKRMLEWFRKHGV
ncbi:MAG TPA: dienelactone hydrolase family protein [Burkholderiales bacterium]|nr:dienelactone hydrolase family protein [Burkholderiales bacterium]